MMIHPAHNLVTSVTKRNAATILWCAQQKQQYALHTKEYVHPGLYTGGGFGRFGRTAHSLVEIREGTCVCMALGHFAWA